jgi:hypothetical protein
MERLNYHHLLYFWMVAREGTVPRAAARLRLAQPALSGQIHRLRAPWGLLGCGPIRALTTFGLGHDRPLGDTEFVDFRRPNGALSLLTQASIFSR